jgi:peptidyl-prolyl cis-trans isomerase C
VKNFFVSSLLCISMLVFSNISCTEKDKGLPQKPLVVVDTRKLAPEEFGSRVARRIKEFDSLYAKQGDTVARVKAEVVSEFISSSLVSIWAMKNGVQVSEAELEKEIHRMRASYPDDLSFRNAFVQEGMTFDRWREDIKQGLLERLVFERVARANDTKPTDKEVQDYYNANKSEFSSVGRIRLRQVVLEKEEDARRVMARIKQGGAGTLEKMAREYSIAPESKRGGDTGWVDKGMLPVFDEAFKLSPGSRSDIIKSPYGYHIYEVISKKAPTQLSLAEAKPAIVKNLSLQRERALFEQWLGEQAKLVKVFKDDALIGSITVHTEGQK